MLSESIKILKEMYGPRVPLHTLFPITMNGGFKCLVEKLTEDGRILILYPRKYIMLETEEVVYGFNTIVGHKGRFKQLKGVIIDFEDDSVAKELVRHNSSLAGDTFETSFGKWSLAKLKEALARGGFPNKIQPIGSLEECEKRKKGAKNRAN